MTFMFSRSPFIRVGALFIYVVLFVINNYYICMYAVVEISVYLFHKSPSFAATVGVF